MALVKLSAFQPKPVQKKATDPVPEREVTVIFKKYWTRHKYRVPFVIEQGQRVRLVFLDSHHERVMVYLSDYKSILVHHSEIEDYYERLPLR